MIGRSAVYATGGLVATSQPLAVQAGLWALERGGTAVDAALAAALVLTVVEPTSNGFGSDAFAVVLERGIATGYNGSGASPRASSLEAVRARSVNGRVPERGWTPVTVPGAPAAWADLHGRFGRLPWDELFVPARRYARDGYPLAPRTAEHWARAVGIFCGREFSEWRAVFLPEGFTPAPGARWSSADHERTLAVLAREGADAFYKGVLAERTAEAARAGGGWIDEDDLAAHEGLWVDPLTAVHDGWGVCTLPPNSQGLVLLEALLVLEAHRRGGGRGGDHETIEAVKRAFADALESLGDPSGADAAQARMLDAVSHHEALASALSDPALDYDPPEPYHGGTVTVAAADGEGRLVSYIQSNYMGFGSGIVVPGTGIALQNRGACFTLRAGLPNTWGAGRRPYHTLVPSLAIAPDGTGIALGVVGGFFQPQGQLQILSCLRRWGLAALQDALHAPRWYWRGGRRLSLEVGFDPRRAAILEGLGHEVLCEPPGVVFGRAQAVMRRPDGILVGASDPRADGLAQGF